MEIGNAIVDQAYRFRQLLSSARTDVNAQTQSEPLKTFAHNTSPSSPSASIPDNKSTQLTGREDCVDDKEDAQRIGPQASESDKSRLADEGKQALTKAVTDQGLSVGEYTAIMQVAQNYPAVRRKNSADKMSWPEQSFNECVGERGFSQGDKLQQ